MLHDLQRLPLALTQTHMGGGGLGLQINILQDLVLQVLLASHLKSLVGVGGHRHGSAGHLLLHEARLVSSCDTTTDEPMKRVHVLTSVTISSDQPAEPQQNLHHPQQTM